MIPDIDILIKKSKDFCMAERKYIMACMQAYVAKQMTNDAYNTRMMLILIKYGSLNIGSLGTLYSCSLT